MMNKFVYNKTVHYMHFSSSYYLQIIFFINVSFYLFFHLLQTFFIGSLFRFPCYLTGSLFRFPYYLQAPFFDLHVICRLPLLIYVLFTASFFFIYIITDMLFTVILQPLCIKFTYLRVSRFNFKKFTAQISFATRGHVVTVLFYSWH